MLLPGSSPHIEILDKNSNYYVKFNGEEIIFLKSDTQVLPVRNITVEELARYLLDKLLEDPDITTYDISAIELRVSSGPGQWGSSFWAMESTVHW